VGDRVPYHRSLLGIVGQRLRKTLMVERSGCRCYNGDVAVLGLSRDCGIDAPMTVDELIAAGICWLCEGCGRMAVIGGGPDGVRMEAWPCDVCGGTGKVKPPMTTDPLDAEVVDG